MGDPEAATASQLRNIEGKTGKTFAQLCKLIADSELTKVGEQRAMLMEELGSATAMPTWSRFVPSRPRCPRQRTPIRWMRSTPDQRRHYEAPRALARRDRQVRTV